MGKFVGAVAALVVLGSSMSMAREGFLLNGLGPSGVYSVFLLDMEGRPTSVDPVITPNPEFKHVYWPAGIKVGNETLIYATVEEHSGPKRLGLWRSSGGPFRFDGIVISPEGDEGEIGSADLVYDPEDKSAPFKMWFGTNYGPRAMAIKYATSLDGKDWKRQGTVIQAAEEYEREGFQIDFVCRDKGVWRMFYSATSDAENRFVAVEARGDAPGGPFVKRGPVFKPSGKTTEVTSELAPGMRILRVGKTKSLMEGHVYVLTNGTNEATQRVVIEKILGDDAIAVAEPVYVTGTGFKMRPTDARKAGISVFFRDPEGRGRALMTGWGAFESVANEFVFEGIEGDKGFSRTPTSEARTFIPTGRRSINSYENPSVIQSGPDCPVFE